MNPAAREAVVIVHGLWMHGVAMALLRRRIAACGYAAAAYSYRSMLRGLAENAAGLAEFATQRDASRVHLVGHSLGGLIALKALAQSRNLPPGRVVLIGSPYVDSAAGRRLGELPGGDALLGRSMREWLDTPHPADFGGREIGVIAGSRGIGLGRLFGARLSVPHDGVVAAAETEVPGRRDRIVLPVTHAGMLLSRAVARQVCAFLHDGIFDRSGDAAGARR